MKPVTRSIAIIRPKRNFIKWANSQSPDGREFSVDHYMEYYSLAILTPYYDLYVRKLAKKYIDTFCKQIFEDQLRHGNPDEKSWPEDRSKEAFKKWFTVEYIYDVVE